MTEHNGEKVVQRDLLIYGQADKKEWQMNNFRKVRQRFILAVIGVVLMGLVAGCAPKASTEPLDSQVAGAPADQAPLARHKITAVPDLPVPAIRFNRSAQKCRYYAGPGKGSVPYGPLSCRAGSLG